MLTDPGYRFCPKCGSGLGTKRIKEFEPDRLVCSGAACGFVLYLNPKVAAGAVIEHDGGIVLLKREIAPRAGYWVHPGGFVDRGETLERAAIRESKEEVGLDIELGRLLGAFSFNDSEVVVIAYAARSVGGNLIAGDESLEACSFRRDEIPWEHLAFPSTHLALREFLRTQDPETGAFQKSLFRQATDRIPGREFRALQAQITGLLTERDAVKAQRDARAASSLYPQLIGLLRQSRRFREALEVAEEGLALTHDPLIARLADEVADELAEAEQERC
jgi:ADP-ribose pyrophosphatase YjhB (NUDIX family)